MRLEFKLKTSSVTNIPYEYDWLYIQRAIKRNVPKNYWKCVSNIQGNEL